jgi:hypothetical protein
MKKRQPSVVALAFLTGCASVMGEYTPGWPTLAIREHYVSQAELYDRCQRYVAFGHLAYACAEFSFADGICNVWYSRDFPPTQAMRKEERDHCDGREHAMDTAMAEILGRASR